LKALQGARPRPAAENFLRAATDDPGVLDRFADWIDRLAIADPELAAIRTALITLFEAGGGAAPIDRASLSLHLSRSGLERAAARVTRWEKDTKPPGRKGRQGNSPEPNLGEWQALMTRQVVLPAIKEELAELSLAAAQGDDAAFARFQALSREARDIEARAREAKLDDDAQDENEADGPPRLTA
jgi:hypothetical protein